MSVNCFIDSNIWLYLFESDTSSNKYLTARKVIEENVVYVSPQVINEVGRNLTHAKKPFQYSELELRTVIDYFFYGGFGLVDLTHNVYLKASELRERYQFSYYDGMIVAAALVANVDMLYSEDFQHGQIIDSKLKILNPFIV